MIHHIECLEFMRGMVDRGERVDAIITDPPYLYLNHKLDRPFNEREFFELASRITDKIVFFGRGDSFYRWNLFCAELGFEFREEIIWNKGYVSSPFQKIGRMHETISIRIKNGGSINRVKLSPTKQSLRNNEIIFNDLKRMIASLRDIKVVEKYLRLGDYLITLGKGKHNITSSITRKEKDRGLNTFQKYKEGELIKSILKEQREEQKKSKKRRKRLNKGKWRLRNLSLNLGVVAQSI